MKNFKEKFKYIYIPFLLISVCFTITYSLLHWLLFINGGLSLKEDIVKFWVPFILPYIPVYIWLRPRIHLLQFKKDNGSFGLQMLAVIAIALPTIITQDYLITATGKLTALDNISNIENKAKTKYYTLKDCYIDKEHVAVTNTATITGKHNTDFNILIYAAIPILNNIEDTAKGECSYWLGKKYSKTISNKKSNEEKDAIYKEFADQCQQEFDSTNFRNFYYLEVLGNNEDHDEYNATIKKSTIVRYRDPIVFKAISNPFEERNGNKLPWIFGSMAIGSAIFLIFLLILKLNQNKLQKFQQGTVEKDNELKEFLAFFIPRPDFYITPIIINLNLLVFVAMVCSGLGFISFKTHDLLTWGANFRPSTIHGEWWRLLTSTFLHGGIMHLLANIYGLLFVGLFLEPILGKLKFAMLYIGTGIFASIANIWWYSHTVSVGASGAIFGLYGFFLGTLLLKVFPPDFSKAFLISTLIFIAFNLLMGITGGIDNAAHIGGLVSGFIVGLAMSKQLKQKLTEPDDEPFEPTENNFDRP